MTSTFAGRVERRRGDFAILVLSVLDGPFKTRRAVGSVAIQHTQSFAGRGVGQRSLSPAPTLTRATLT